MECCSAGWINRVLVGGIAGGVVLFFWSFVSWMLLPWHNMTMSRFENESIVLEMLEHQAPREGVYLAPFPEDPSQHEATGGPMVLAAFQPAMEAGMGKQLVVAIVGNVLAAALAMVLLLQTKGSYTT